eukprot:2020607-Amphidinium_carterae.2
MIPSPARTAAIMAVSHNRQVAQNRMIARKYLLLVCARQSRLVLRSSSETPKNIEATCPSHDLDCSTK